jgi:hypothetical protein
MSQAGMQAIPKKIASALAFKKWKEIDAPPRT